VNLMLIPLLTINRHSNMEALAQQYVQLQVVIQLDPGSFTVTHVM
jgi:hypothetical protein